MLVHNDYFEVEINHYGLISFDLQKYINLIDL